jgi:PPK2 family polyphosphate:nucleotide phosphotransferase
VRATESFRELRLRPGQPVHIAKFDARDTSSFPGRKRRAEARLPALREELDRLQEMFYADGRRGLLVVLQGMDTSGKDGTIRHVFEGVNPQGVRVWSFKVPTPFEQAHDFLWRIHQHTPAKGEVAIFNRSHYEDILVARVHHLVPRSVWSKRYGEINEFERELVDEGVSVVKFCLFISREEQAVRLRERLEDRSKQWKLTEADVRERAYWPQYMRAYEEMLRRTTTPWAPWYLVPSDHKWFRNLVVSTVLVDTFRAMDLKYPAPGVDLAKFRVD